MPINLAQELKEEIIKRRNTTINNEVQTAVAAARAAAKNDMFEVGVGCLQAESIARLKEMGFTVNYRQTDPMGTSEHFLGWDV